MGVTARVCEGSVRRVSGRRSKAPGGELQRFGLCVNVRAHSEGDIGVAEPSRDEGDGHPLEMHERGAGVPRIMQPDLGYLKIADGLLHSLLSVDGDTVRRPRCTRRSPCRRKPRRGAASRQPAGSSPRRARPEEPADGEHATRVGRLGFVLVKRPATHVDARRADAQCPVLQIEIGSKRCPAISPRRSPASARCQACRLRSSAMPREHHPHLIWGVRLGVS